jgi:hypothetical protein
MTNTEAEWREEVESLLSEGGRCGPCCSKEEDVAAIVTLSERRIVRGCAQGSTL